LKMTGDAALISPPLIAERHHIDKICEVMRQTLAEYWILILVGNN